MPEFTYKEVNEIISKSDVIWFSKTKFSFPKIIFEVEASTDFTNSMHKMYQVINFDARFYLIASEGKRNVYESRINREPFNSVKEKFTFRTFENVTELYYKTVEQNEIKSKFLNYE